VWVVTNEPSVLGLVLAGGEGKRLMPLTADRAKPAVPFGGSYRLIDFVLSNLVNGGYRRIGVLTQFKSHSLDRHITTTWAMSPLVGNYITPVPAQQRLGPRWYQGSADAIFQSLNLVYDERPDVVVVFGADHVYRMDPRQMVEEHIASGAGITVAGIRFPQAESHQFGVIDPGEGSKIKGFLEKPDNPPVYPGGSGDESLISMGNYVFNTEVLLEALRIDAGDEGSVHDMGGNIVPMLVNEGIAHYYDFANNKVPGETDRDRGYWRDVGTLDAYHDAHMDLVSIHPIFNLYNRKWPILTRIPPAPPAKFVEGGVAHESLVTQGSIIAGAHVRHSVISRDVVLQQGSYIEASVLLDGVQVGQRAVVRNAILDKNVVVEDGAQIGVDIERDRLRFTVSPNGIVAVGKGTRVTP
jgi:glucose-1-phosphate adenylyltransferase